MLMTTYATNCPACMHINNTQYHTPPFLRELQGKQKRKEKKKERNVSSSNQVVHECVESDMEGVYEEVHYSDEE